MSCKDEKQLGDKNFFYKKYCLRINARESDLQDPEATSMNGVKRLYFMCINFQTPKKDGRGGIEDSRQEGWRNTRVN